MHIGRRALLALGASGWAGGAAAAQVEGSAPATEPYVLPAPEKIALWPLTPPEPTPKGLIEHNAGGLMGIAQPRLEVFHPPAGAPRGRAVLVVPGGGYQRLALHNEGYATARYLAPRGFTVCVLVYRLPSEGWSARGQAPLQDIIRAMRIMRRRASDWGVDAAGIGVIGYSAGGHLAGMLATRFNQPAYTAHDALDALPARPAYAALIYPVITLNETSAYMVSRRNLLGDFPLPWQVAAYAVDQGVTAETPPVFLVHAADDPIVPANNSILMFQAMLATKAKAELHIFEAGGHGFGLTPKSTAVAWPELYLKWAKAQGFIA